MAKVIKLFLLAFQNYWWTNQPTNQPTDQTSTHARINFYKKKWNKKIFFFWNSTKKKMKNHITWQTDMYKSSMERQWRWCDDTWISTEKNIWYLNEDFVHFSIIYYYYYSSLFKFFRYSVLQSSSIFHCYIEIV